MSTTFDELIVRPLLHSLSSCQDNNAFYIEGCFYSYRDMAKAISKIRAVIKNISEANVGLVANDDIETYASIFALWLEGKCYVPLHPEQPIQRCLDIVSQVGMNYILDSSEASRYKDIQVIMTHYLSFDKLCLEYTDNFSDDTLAYILFTSGSTGKPKGVPLSRGNVAGFVDAFYAMDIKLDSNDHCLQMFDLTFDLSVQSYLIPLLVGACVYTVSPKRIKYEAVFELLDEENLTFALMVPSVIHYLRPYMDEIDAPSMRYSLFCGEALPLDDTECWSRCVPNARIDNVYGPTENTIYCTDYIFNREGENKESNGVLSIGKSMKGTQTIIVDEKNEILAANEKGELCLAGMQLTPGYWNNPDKNQEAFFLKDGTRFYRTGDICTMDSDGDILYFGRKDSQVKIQGFRIELSEIECIARKFYDNSIAVVAIPLYDNNRNCTIQLVVESTDRASADTLTNYLKEYLPPYMIPQRIHFLERFPLNVNNKIDRKKITTLL